MAPVHRLIQINAVLEDRRTAMVMVGVPATPDHSSGDRVNDRLSGGDAPTRSRAGAGQYPCNKDAPDVAIRSVNREYVDNPPYRRSDATSMRQSRFLALAAAALLIASTQPYAAVINVGGQCSIFRAIISANNDASPKGYCTQGVARHYQYPAGHLQYQ
jgi:hypothetical protein